MNDLRKTFDDLSPAFVDRSGAALPDNQPWAPVTVTKEQIDAEIERLASLPLPADGRRASLIVHPMALAMAPGLAPGIQVTLSVLKPGERTSAFRHNATEINFCILGGGEAVVGKRRLRFGQYDLWNIPSYATYHRVNTGSGLQVCLTYTNASLLQFMQIYVAEKNPVEAGATPIEPEEHNPRAHSPYGTFGIGSDGAMLMPYEQVINPPPVQSDSLFWPWDKVRAELAKLESLGPDYTGRRLYLLYNPMTGRTNGTTPNFFATITVRPPNIVDRPHRHVSAAINYYFSGSGRSSVAGNVYEWKAGDLMLSAPGWTVHNHASYDENVHELTVQDQPLNILMESLLWQENMKAPPILLGTHGGFETNRDGGGAR
ncbi:MAG: gentisate 1,2-dioxygenase [Bradyrhizobium sp.]|nr:gentisate 1,2-dioxygenase [Bradyrhizobium sp.]